MNNQLEIETGLRPKIRNLLILEKADELHQFLDIPAEVAKEACQVRNAVEKEFWELLGNFVDSEKLQAQHNHIEKFEKSLIESLIYHAQRHG